MPNVLRIHPDDSVAVALEPLSAGAAIDALGVTLADDIPQGHKFALEPIGDGKKVLKYGVVIGLAKEAIAPGAHVHTHNLWTALGDSLDYSYEAAPAPVAKLGAIPSFPALERKNGDIGVRNDLWIIPLVGCINGLAAGVARSVETEGLPPPGSRATVLSHPYGCSQLGGDLDNTRNSLRDYVCHPNAGGVLVRGLGCENNTMAEFRDGFEMPDPARVRFLTTQDCRDERAAAMTACRELTASMAGDRRVMVGADRLRVGLKCGGSDGHSGITANPLLGAFSDWLTGIGGATVLTEFAVIAGFSHRGQRP